mgnify:CR=1 FL=1
MCINAFFCAKQSHKKIINDLTYYVQTQNEQFFNSNLLNKISAFPYQKNYAQRSESFIRGHFGEKATKEIFALEISSKWQGPIQSPYGFHIIKLTSVSEAKQKSFDEVDDLLAKQDQLDAKAVTDKEFNDANSKIS